jgi:hypothetical protein
MALNSEDKIEAVPFTSMKDGEVAEPSPSASLPPPVSAAAAPKPKPKIPVLVIIPLWMVLSVSVILYNNHLYTVLDFKFPVFLVTWHLTFAVRLSRKTLFKRLTCPCRQ